MQIAIDLPWARRKSAFVEMPNVELPHVDLAAKVEDTKRVVSDGADSISSVAHELGTQATSLGREAVKIGKDAAKISREAARKGQLWAANSGETLRHLRADAASTVDDLRSIRIVREKRRGLDLKPGIALLAGASAGVAAMFFLDPERGHRRRMLFIDQVRHYSRLSSEWLGSTTRDLRNRSEGWAAEARRAANSAAESMNRTKMTDAEEVLATPDVSTQLSSTDWSEPAPAEPVTADTYHN